MPRIMFCLCTPSERTKLCLDVRGVERAWNGVAVGKLCLRLAGHAVQFSLSMLVLVPSEATNTVCVQ